MYKIRQASDSNKNFKNHLIEQANGLAELRKILVSPESAWLTESPWLTESVPSFWIRKIAHIKKVIPIPNPGIQPTNRKHKLK